MPGDVVLSGIIVARKPAATQVGLAGSGSADELDAEPALELPEFVFEAVRSAVAWAHRRALGLSSACGIWIAMAACAATWFSAGTRAGNFRAVIALWAGFLVLVAGRLLTRDELTADEHDAVQAPVSATPAPPGFRRATTADRRLAGPASWLAALGISLGEAIVYAGLALGAAAEHWPDAWTLAIAVIGFSGVRNLMTACSTPPGFGEEPAGVLRRVSTAVVTMPLGGRILLVGIVAPVWGARAALLALLDWAIISVGYGIAGRARPELTATPDHGDGTSGSSELVRLRDDGVLARGLGSLVRGGLLPLPPAVLGLAAIAALTLVGLHSMAGALTIGPAIVMLLAAPGAGHPHNGRFDWLVPVLLLSSQLLYFAAAGRAAGVPGPLIYALLAAVLLRYCDLADPKRLVMLARSRQPGDQPAERGSGLGWEGRLVVAGLGAALGIATVAYLALTAYLGVLICLKVMTSFHTPPEDDSS